LCLSIATVRHDNGGMAKLGAHALSPPEGEGHTMRFPHVLPLAAAVLVGVNLAPASPSEIRPTVRPKLSTGHPMRGNVAAARGAVIFRRYSIPDKQGIGDVYVSDYGNNVLYGFPASGGSPSYVVSSGINGPQGLAETAQNVYVANTNLSQILVFTPPSTTPTLTINDANEYPAGVAVNKKGDQIWVSNICSAPSCGMGNLEEYNAAGVLQKAITCSNMFRYYFVGTDNKGNAAVDGEDASGAPTADVIPAGSSTCTAIAPSLEFPGGVEFTSNGNLAIDDQDAGTVTVYAAPNFSSVVSTTPLGGGICDPVTFGFAAKDASLITANACSGDATQFAFPGGGSPDLTWSGMVEPIGVAGGGCGASSNYRGGIADADAVAACGGIWFLPPHKISYPGSTQTCAWNATITQPTPVPAWALAQLPGGATLLQFFLVQFSTGPASQCPQALQFGKTARETSFTGAYGLMCGATPAYKFAGYTSQPSGGRTFFGPVGPNKIVGPRGVRGIVDLRFAVSAFNGINVVPSGGGPAGADYGLAVYC